MCRAARACSLSSSDSYSSSVWAGADGSSFAVTSLTGRRPNRKKPKKVAKKIKAKGEEEGREEDGGGGEGHFFASLLTRGATRREDQDH